MLNPTQLRDLSSLKNTYMPAVCVDGSIALFVSPTLKDEDFESLQRFSLKLAPEVFIIDPTVFCPLRICVNTSNTGLNLELFQDSDYIHINKAKVDPALCKKLMLHVSNELMQNVKSALEQYYDISENKTNSQDIDSKNKTLLSMFAPKNNPQVTLEDIFKNAESLCEKLNSEAEAIRVVAPSQKQVATEPIVQKPLNIQQPTPKNIAIENQQSANAAQIEALNAEIKRLNEQLLVTEQVLKDSADVISKQKRNNLYAGALAGAASMYLSVDYLDQNKKTSTTGKIAASAIGFTLGLIPYTRYATIAAAPFIADKLIASGTLNLKDSSTKQKLLK